MKFRNIFRIKIVLSKQINMSYYNATICLSKLLLKVYSCLKDLSLLQVGGSIQNTIALIKYSTCIIDRFYDNIMYI